MRKAPTLAIAGSMLLCALAAAENCGGDDTSPGPAAATSTGASGATGSSSSSSAAGSSTSSASGTAGSTGSGSGGGTGSGGAGADAGGCPAMQPAAGTACDADDDCHYGSFSCSCVDMGWTCHQNSDGGGNCPATEPDPSGDCTQDGQECSYSGGHLLCTCDLQAGWSCVSSRP